MCLRGTLSEELALRGSAFLLMDLFQLAVQVADGMKHLESKGLVHGELKASNVLMKSARQVSRTHELSVNCLEGSKS